MGPWPTPHIPGRNHPGGERKEKTADQSGQQSVWPIFRNTDPEDPGERLARGEHKDNQVYKALEKQAEPEVGGTRTTPPFFWGGGGNQ